jgi:hypothetical protein
LIYDDIIYGPAEITEPVLLDLMASAAMSRLKGVYQGGITALLGIAPDFNRFDHSMGVCLLLRRFGAPLEEQIAGLLHDVSHTAFSHVVDFLYNNSDQDYHERLYAATIAGSDVPAILARHGYDWRDFLDESRFPLLEQPLPAICADRLDYFCRDAVPLGLADRVEIAACLDHLTVRAGRICVLGTDGLGPARWLGRTFIAADAACWSELREMALYQLTADALRAGLAAGCLAESDLLGTDRPLWARLTGCADPAVAALVARIHPATRFVLNPATPDLIFTAKVRALDPEVWAAGRLQPLSALDAAFAADRAAYLARKSGPTPVRIVAEETR